MLVAWFSLFGNKDHEQPSKVGLVHHFGPLKVPVGASVALDYYNHSGIIALTLSKELFDLSSPPPLPPVTSSTFKRAAAVLAKECGVFSGVSISRGGARQSFRQSSPTS
jgi:hypothetical protein